MRVRLTLPQLSTFLKLAELGSFRDAALALGISQPALSRTIQLIEGRVGARLFDRDTRSVTLTPVGLELRPLAERIIANYDDTFAEIDEFISGRRGRVRIAAFPTIAAALLPPAIAHFQAAHPAVRVDIWEDVASPIHRALIDGHADLGLATPPSPSPQLNFKLLLNDELVLLCRADDPLAAQEVCDWTAFERRPFIAMSAESGLRAMIEGAFAQAGVAVQPLYNCKQVTTVGSLVGASLGVSALPRSALSLLSWPELTSRPLVGPSVFRQIGVISPVRSLPPSSLLFMRELEQQARQLSFGKLGFGADACVTA